MALLVCTNTRTVISLLLFNSQCICLLSFVNSPLLPPSLPLSSTLSVPFVFCVLYAGHMASTETFNDVGCLWCFSGRTLPHFWAFRYRDDDELRDFRRFLMYRVYVHSAFAFVLAPSSPFVLTGCLGFDKLSVRNHSMTSKTSDDVLGASCSERAFKVGRAGKTGRKQRVRGIRGVKTIVEQPFRPASFDS